MPRSKKSYIKTKESYKGQKEERKASQRALSKGDCLKTVKRGEETKMDVSTG